MLLPLLLAPAQAGNLGAADEVMFGVDAKTPDYSQTSFKVHVGHMAGRGTDRSVASFSDGQTWEYPGRTPGAEGHKKSGQMTAENPV